MKRSIQWAYGITTVPKRRQLFNRTLKSLRVAGFDEPRLFVDGLQNSREVDGYALPVTTHNPTVLTSGNWVLALWELYTRQPEADRYAIFQDDIVTYKNLRQFLEHCAYPEKGYLNLCTYPQNQDLADGREGWYPSNQMGRGAQALVFNRPAVVELLSSRHLVMRAQRVGRKRGKCVDGSISHAFKNAGWQEFVHNPSLVYHTGDVSSMQDRVQPLVQSFQGEDFDALQLAGTLHNAKPVNFEVGNQCLVTGAGGFIGGHLVKRLCNEGFAVRAVDIKPLSGWWQVDGRACNFPEVDLRKDSSCHFVCQGQDQIYNLAADMGGIGFIENNKSACMSSVLINTHLLMAAIVHNVKRYFYASSACVYHSALQNSSKVKALQEVDAYVDRGASPEDGYGWEKLFSERMCRHYYEDYGLDVRVARFHNIYGPHGSWQDGREKAPAALCRKVAKARQHYTEQIEVWGDGTLTRSFCWIGDCIEGILRLMVADPRTRKINWPLNLGSSKLVTIDQLLSTIEKVANTEVRRVYQLDKPQGVAGRNSDNTRIKRLLEWEPSTPLDEGIAKTYPWIEEQVKCNATQKE